MASMLIVVLDPALVRRVPLLEADLDLILSPTSEPPGEQNRLAASASCGNVWSRVRPLRMRLWPHCTM